MATTTCTKIATAVSSFVGLRPVITLFTGIITITLSIGHAITFIYGFIFPITLLIKRNIIFKYTTFDAIWAWLSEKVSLKLNFTAFELNLEQ